MSAPFRLLDTWALAFRPNARLPASVWCENNLVLPPNMARPGKLEFQRWQALALDLFFHPGTRTMAAMIASQIGKTTLQDAIIGYTMAGSDIGPSLLVLPTDAVARAYVRDRLNPLIETSPVLAAAVGGGQGGAGNSVSFKTFPGGSLAIASSHDPASLASKAIRYVILDEYDRCARSAGREGDPLFLAMRRQFSFEPLAKTYVSSSPTVRDSRIAALFRRGSQHRYMCPCPECGTLDALEFANLKWTEGKPQTARLMCEHCGHHITEAERKAAIESPSSNWFATSDEGEPGLITLHATELISSFSSMERLAANAEIAGDDTNKRRTFVNTALAAVFDAGESYEVSAEELQARAIPLASPYDNSVQHVVVGADVQRNRIEALWLATMPGGAAVIRYEVFHGDTAGTDPWVAFDRALGVPVVLKDGRKLAISATCVDSGYMPDTVADFVKAQRSKSRKCFASKGVGGPGKPAIRVGAKMSTGAKLLLIGTHDLKKFLLERLRLSDPKAPGFIHLADHLGEEVFEGFASERLETKPNPKGYDTESFVKVVARNEALDCLVLAHAIGRYAIRSVQQPTNTPRPTLAESMAKLNGPRPQPGA